MATSGTTTFNLNIDDIIQDIEQALKTAEKTVRNVA